MRNFIFCFSLALFTMSNSMAATTSCRYNTPRLSNLSKTDFEAKWWSCSFDIKLNAGASVKLTQSVTYQQEAGANEIGYNGNRFIQIFQANGDDYNYIGETKYNSNNVRSSGFRNGLQALTQYRFKIRLNKPSAKANYYRLVLTAEGDFKKVN